MQIKILITQEEAEEIIYKHLTETLGLSVCGETDAFYEDGRKYDRPVFFSDDENCGEPLFVAYLEDFPVTEENGE
jgi:hypothetical protein